jgi:ABC-type multidrug transport system fused ATPase/permease subunit
MEEPLLDHASSSLSVATGSNITFSWMSPLLDIGKRKTLDLSDLPFLDDSDSVHGIFPDLKSKITTISATCQYTELTTVKLVKALVLTTWKLIIVTAVCALLSTVSSYVGPYLIEHFVDYLNEGPRDIKRGYFLVLAFVAAQFLEGLSSRHLHFRSQQLGVRVRAALVAIIYHKGLILSNQSIQGTSSGELTNVVSLDAENLGGFNSYMHELWLLPVQISLVMVILYYTLGLAAFAALAATVLTMLANMPLGRLEQNYQEKTMNAKDARMSAMSEILQNMRILKLQGWELTFFSKIKELRKVEMDWIKKYVYTSSMLISVFFGAPAFVAMVTFGTCMLLGIPLEAGKVLSALATFRQLQDPIHKLPDTISSIIQTKVSLGRICSFLCLEELANDAVTKLPSDSTDTTIEVRNGCFSWDKSSPVPTLQDLNFSIQQGMRVAICGTVGSGKSSLLSCILGEVPKLSGEVRTCGKIACVSQSPWIQSGTIEHNVLFWFRNDQGKI